MFDIADVLVFKRRENISTMTHLRKGKTFLSSGDIGLRQSNRCTLQMHYITCSTQANQVKIINNVLKRLSSGSVLRRQARQTFKQNKTRLPSKLLAVVRFSSEHVDFFSQFNLYFEHVIVSRVQTYRIPYKLMSSFLQIILIFWYRYPNVSHDTQKTQKATNQKMIQILIFIKECAVAQ